MTTPPKIVPKGWGSELHIHNADGYCGKVLHFTKAGNKFSLHYHIKKTETWLFRNRFKVTTIDPVTAQRHTIEVKKDDIIHVLPGVCHQLEAMEDDAEVFEVSTPDDPADSYRVEAGDSQVELPKCEDCGSTTPPLFGLGHGGLVRAKCKTPPEPKLTCVICGKPGSGEQPLLPITKTKFVHDTCQPHSEPVPIKCFKCGADVNTPYTIRDRDFCERCFLDIQAGGPE